MRIKGVDDFVEERNDFLDVPGLHGLEHIARVKTLIVSEKRCIELSHGRLDFTIGIAQQESAGRVYSFDGEIAGLEKDGIKLKLGEFVCRFLVISSGCDQLIKPDEIVGVEIRQAFGDDRGASCGCVPVIPKAKGRFI